jgi:hypothetical protein
MCISACDLILCLQVALAHQSLSINLFLVWRESHQPLMVGTFLPRDLLVTGTRGHGKVKSSFRPTNYELRNLYKKRRRKENKGADCHSTWKESQYTYIQQLAKSKSTKVRAFSLCNVVVWSKSRALAACVHVVCDRCWSSPFRNRKRWAERRRMCLAAPQLCFQNKYTSALTSATYTLLDTFFLITPCGRYGTRLYWFKLWKISETRLGNSLF